MLADKARFTIYHCYHIELSQLLAKRLDGYVEFLRLIHNIIYRMHTATSDVKAATAFRLQHPELTIPERVTQPQPSHYPDA